MVKYLTKKCKQNRGFTLMEVMVVVAILAVIVMIAVPSVISMRKNMQFTQRNDYAKSIFMAAQSNLTEMRSTGLLKNLSPAEDEESEGTSESAANLAIQQNTDSTGTPPNNYYYTWSEDGTYYDYVLPVNSVDSTIRDEQVIIEYNPKAGIVYSVFYYEGDDGELLSMYTGGSIDRNDEDKRKEQLVGYYSVGSVDALEAQELNVCQTSASLSYTNAQEGMLTVKIPIVDNQNNNIFPTAGTELYPHYIARLEVTLTVTGENGGSFSVTLKGSDSNNYFDEDSFNNAVLVNFPLDSLKSSKNSGSDDDDDGSSDNGENTDFAIYSFPVIANKNYAEDTVDKIKLGDNVSITAEVTFYSDADDPIVMIESATLAGINPMYHSLTQNPEYTDGSTTVKPYILAISNARHLQNLDYLDGAFAQNIESIVFVAQTEEDTVTNSGTGGTGGSGTDGNTSGGTSNGSDSNSDSSKEEGISAQVLTVSDTNTNTNSGNTTEGENVTPVNTEIAIDLKDIDFTPIDFSDNFTTTDKIPKIIGNGVKISNLNINTPEKADHTGLSTGMFTELTNASIEGIQLIDPIVTNESAALTTNAAAFDEAAATGALIGTADGVTVKDCSVISTADTSHISGKQLVGGLVGYAKGSSKFVNCTADMIVGHSETTVANTDSIRYSIGGLVGYSDGSEFMTCDTTAAVHGLAATKTDLGGLVGKAVSTTLTDCTTKATVSGVDEYLCNAGGLVGYASNTTFSNCDAVSSNGLYVTVESGEYTHYSAGETKNTLGGLVGYAEGTTAAPTKFTNCNISKETTVTSSNYANSDLGGLVGYAKGVTFKTCSSNASVNGTVKVDKEGNTKTDIPNNNLGGLVGNSEGSTYESITVALNYQPTYAQDAGGFVGVMKGGSISSLTVSINVPAEDAAAGTVENFGAIASVCSSSVSTNEKETITATITGTLDNAKNLAGAFYRVNGSTVENIHVDIQGRLNGSDKTAGFVVLNEASGYIYDSSVKGNIPAADAAGFVYHNYTKITRCIANVTLNGGNVFTMVNEGTITDCYGWTNASSVDNPVGGEETKCYSSYFGSTSDNPAVVLYDSDGVLSEDIIYTDALASDWALDLLNGEDSVWMLDIENEYPYPHLNTFKDPIRTGPTPKGGNYAYGVLYIEKYADDTQGYYVTDISSNESYDNLTNGSAITETAYYIYHRTSSKTSGVGSAMKYDALGDFGLNRLYSIYPVTAGASSVTIGSDSISVNTYFGPVNSNGAYRIRTSGQFANIAHDTNENFVIETNITAPGTISTFSGTITNTGNYTITTSAPLFDKLTGKLTGLKVNATIDAGENAYGAIANTLDGGDLTSCTVTGSITGANAAVFVGNAKSGTFTGCSADISGVPFASFPSQEITGSPSHYTTSSSFGDEYIYSISSNSTGLSLTSIEKMNFTPVTGDITLSECTLNGKSITLTHYYFYTIGELQTETSPSVTDVIVPQRVNSPSYETFWDLNDWTESSEWIATDYLFKDSSDKIQVLEIKMDYDSETVKTDTVDEEGNTVTTETVEKTYNLYYRAKGSTGDGSKKTTDDLSSNINLSLYQYGISIPTSGTYVLYNAAKNMIWDDAKSDWVENTNRSEDMIWCVSDEGWKNYGSKRNLTIGNIDPNAADKALVSVTIEEKTFNAYLYSINAWKTLTKVDEANAVNS